MPWTNFIGFQLAMHTGFPGALVNTYPCIGISIEPNSLPVMSFPLGERSMQKVKTLYNRLFLIFNCTTSYLGTTPKADMNICD